VPDVVSEVSNSAAVQECGIHVLCAVGGLERNLPGDATYQASGSFPRAGPSRVLRVLPIGCEPSLSYTPAPSDIENPQLSTCFHSSVFIIGVLT
jgi:hypothetical protein